MTADLLVARVAAWPGRSSLDGMPPTPPNDRRRHGPAAATRRWTAVEVTVGAALLAAAAVVGFFLAHRPGPNRLDRAGDFLLPAAAGSHLAKELVQLGSLPVLVVGVIVIFVVAILQDWVRAIACAVAPLAAVAVAEHIAKPLVGREIAIHEFTYPSGTVTVTAALAAAAFLAAPLLLRPLVALVGMAAILGVSAGVLALRWHYPTDVLGGIFVGAGSVFLLDGVAHLPWVLRRPQTDSSVEPPVISSAV